MRQVAQVLEQVTLEAEVGTQHLGDAEGEMAVRDGKQDRLGMSAPKSWTFFWWQEGQNQRPLQENASRYSCLQSSQRARAKPRSRSPQSRSLFTTSGMTGRRNPYRGW